MRTNIVYIISLLLLLLTVTSVASAEQETKTRARLDVEYFNTSVNERYLTLKVTTRIDRRHEPVSGVEIEVYLNEISDTSELGSIITNSEGTCTFILPPKFYKALDTLSEFTFLCSITDNPQVLDRQRELVVHEIDLKTEYIDQDTLKWIRAIVLTKNNPDHYTPLENIEVKFFVTRPFNMLEISEQQTTDAEGKATIQFPLDLPGDATGHVVAVVKIDDSDDYGTIEKRETVQWGVPTVFSDDSIKRSLWAAGANAPIYLLLLTNGLIAITWGIIFYIAHQIYRISKL